jgi:hypothetical protein
MARFNIEKIDSALESRIVAAALTNPEFIRDVQHVIDLGYFKNPLHQKIVKWAVEHYSRFESAINDGIKIAIEAHKPKLKPDEYENYLQLVDDIFSRIATKGAESNTPYLVQETIKFFKKRELEITAHNILYHLERGDVPEAEKVWAECVKVEQRFSDVHDLFDEALMQKQFTANENLIFKMPGELGSFLGLMERGWLVGIMGAYKTGKTWCAMEFGIIGMLSHLNVAFFSLEMTEKGMYERIFKRLMAATTEQNGIVNPVFDCGKNQRDECAFARRTNNIALDWQAGEPIDLRRNSRYKVCTFCKEHRNFFQHYEPATWFEKVQAVIPYNEQTVSAARLKFERYFKNRFRFKSYPRFTANIQDIKNDLRLLEQKDGWVPDIIIVDYADILKPEDGSALEGYEKEDRTWIALSQLAGEKRSLVITPTQITKDGLEAHSIKVKHTARWSGKLGHVDMMLAINQTPQEKKMGVMRISVLEHRHNEFHEIDSCLVLQNLKTAQVHLDSVRAIPQDGGE